jgi:pyridoxine 5-phosphate synthase
MRIKLGLNIDHVATVRQARKAEYPDPVHAAVLAEMAGAESITVHLREDRRHIQDRDVYAVQDAINIGLNLEMANHPEIVEIALKVCPEEVCIVPEKRKEVTTEGGLDVVVSREALKKSIARLNAKGILVSLFIDPEIAQIDAAKEAGAGVVELHTGTYANAKNEKQRLAELEKLRMASAYAASIGLQVNAGHGLNYRNVYDVAKIKEMNTLNIGHAIIGRAIMSGLDRAVRDMIDIMNRAAEERDD